MERRHCDRSEAVHPAGLHGLPRYYTPRNDVFVSSSRVVLKPWQSETLNRVVHVGVDANLTSNFK
jgi:hypothetical protein